MNRRRPEICLRIMREWPLIMWSGEATKREVGEVREVLPLQKEGAKTVLTMWKGGGGNKFPGRFNVGALSLAILMRGHNKFPPRAGAQNV